MSLQTFSSESRHDWSELRAVVRAADEAGVDRLVLSDHVVFGENLEAYGAPTLGGRVGGKQPTGPDGSWLEPLTTIAHLSALAPHIRFGTNILIAALRRPVVLAKMVATIDVLSDGRLDLGVGVGWQREEYEAAGLSFGERGRLLDRTLEVCQALWRQERVSYRSDELTFSGIHQMPKPIQPGGVPIWVAGTANARVMDRLSTFGKGWIPWGADADDVGRGIGRMRTAVSERGRDPDEIAVVGNLRPRRDENGDMDIGRTLAEVPRLRTAGVTDFRIALSPPTGHDQGVQYLGALVSAFRSAAA